ncbi:hypothetical protein DFH06DRAFT_1399162 [Mycena polygramma]|nr:hypothetical protein DFH06DRAFT_1399162 [Mycena polygramma]
MYQEVLYFDISMNYELRASGPPGPAMMNGSMFEHLPEKCRHWRPKTYKEVGKTAGVLSTQGALSNSQHATMPNYWNGLAPIETYTTSPTLPTSPGQPNTVGKLLAPANTTEDKSHFVVGSSYGYTGYAFYWDGAGPAFWHVGGSTLAEPVGTSWTDATSVPWGTEVISGANVQAQAQTAVNRDDQIIAYIVQLNDLDYSCLRN